MWVKFMVDGRYDESANSGEVFHKSIRSSRETHLQISWINPVAPSLFYNVYDGASERMAS